MKFRIPGSTAIASAISKGEKDNVATTTATDRQSTDLAGASEKSKEAGITTDATPEDDASENAVNADAQHGTQAAQAMTQVWTKQDLIIAYIMIWVVEFVLSFSAGITGTLTPYVTSSFLLHSLTATTDIVSTLVGGLFKLPFAKIMDIWGRPQAFALMVLSMTVGLIMMAGCNNVKTYAAAQVFYSVGYYGIDFSLTIFIADTSSIRNRAFMIAFSGSPYLITTWVAGPAVTSILNTMGFRWGFGIWAIVLPIVCAPLGLLFWLNQRKAEKMGLVPQNPSRGSWWQTIYYYCIQFDVVGLLLLCTGLSLFLLSFSIYSYQSDEWHSPLIICFLVFGILLVIAFALWEKYLAPVTFCPWELLHNRTIFFTFTMAFSLYMAWYIWDSYFYSLCIVLFNQNITQATYIGNIYTMGSTFIALLMGVAVRYYGRIKYYGLFVGVPFTILGVGLMIKFRHADVNIGYIVMTQIFIAFGGGILVICEQMTVMAVTAQKHIPAILAIESVVVSIGSSVGLAIAAAIWTGVFPNRLMRNLPADALADFDAIYGDLDTQSGYPWGSPTRDAINKSYGQTQRIMLIAATCMYSITLVSTMLWRDIDVKNMRQRNRGVV